MVSGLKPSFIATDESILNGDEFADFHLISPLNLVSAANRSTIFRSGIGSVDAIGNAWYD